MTKQRELICRIVQNTDRHLTAEEIFVLAREQMPSIVRATVYNNLSFLTENGMLRRIRIYGGPDRYDRVLAPHEHLICDRCGRLTDLTVGDLINMLKKKTGLEITGYELNLHYICPECLAKGSGPGSPAGTDGNTQERRRSAEKQKSAGYSQPPGTPEGRRRKTDG